MSKLNQFPEASVRRSVLSRSTGWPVLESRQQDLHLRLTNVDSLVLKNCSPMYVYKCSPCVGSLSCKVKHETQRLWQILASITGSVPVGKGHANLGCVWKVMVQRGRGILGHTAPHLKEGCLHGWQDTRSDEPDIQEPFEIGLVQTKVGQHQVVDVSHDGRKVGGTQRDCAVHEKRLTGEINRNVTPPGRQRLLVSVEHILDRLLSTGGNRFVEGSQSRA